MMSETIIGLWTGIATAMTVIGMIVTLFNDDKLTIKLSALAWVLGLIGLTMSLYHYLG